MQKTYLLALALALACATVAASAQTRIYVTTSGSGAGTSWSDARSDLATAMAQAQPNTEIWVAQGTYRPLECSGTCGDFQRLVSFELKPSVAVIGGFVGNETSASQADASNTTVLSGDIGVAGDRTDNTYNVVLCDQCGTDASLRNLTISGGFADRARSSGETGIAGAGIYFDGDNYGGRTGEASPTLTDCVLEDNVSRGQGGAAFLDGAGGGEASPTFLRCRFEGNESGSDGGALYLTAIGSGTASPSFTASQFIDNATVNFGDDGSRSGGALFIGSTGGTAEVTFDRCLATGNATDISLTNGSENTGANGGFAYVQSAKGATDTKLTMRNSVISDNSAYAAGGVYDNGGLVSFTNVTVVNNTALGMQGSGGGLYINGGTATVVNGISYGNGAPNNSQAGRDFRFVNGTLNVSYTLVQAADADEAFSEGDPANNDDVYNEGPGMIYGTDPAFVDANASVPTLQSSSPAVDVGDDSEAYAVGGDYFGATRIDGGTVDLGATEFQGAPVPVELVAFGGEPVAKGVALSWRTAVEIDVEGFRVLRGTDSEDLREIAFAPAIGAGDYQFTDDAVQADTRYYYQLESVDYDGSTQRSGLIAVTPLSSREIGTLVAYPNPAAATVYLSFPHASGSDVAVALTDLTGRTVRTARVSPSDSRPALSLTGIPAGAYVLTVGHGRDAITTLLTVRP